jgi:Arc/MetJ family transcription regulator
VAGVRTTITIDDELFRKAVEVADPGMDKAEIVREAMRVFVRVQSAKRLAALGGAEPRMQDIPRRRAAGRTAR